MLVGGEAVKDTPVSVSVSHAAEACWCDGPGAEAGVAGAANDFTVHVGESAAGLGPPVVVLRAKEPSAGLADVAAEVRDNGDGTFSCSYEPAPGAAGEYELVVQVGGHDIKGSPRDLCVSHRAADAAQSRAEGPGLEKAVVGQESSFVVRAMDAEGRPTLGADCQVSMTGAPATEVRVADNGDGTFSCSYTCVASGVCSISVLVGGEAVKDTPVSVSVSSEVFEKYIPKKGDPVDEMLAVLINKHKLTLPFERVPGKPGQYSIGSKLKVCVFLIRKSHTKLTQNSHKTHTKLTQNSHRICIFRCTLV